MLLALLATTLAAQDAPALTPAQTEAFQAAGRTWAQCTRRYLVRQINAPSAPGDSQLMSRAFRACARDEAQVRAIAVGIVGEERAGPLMDQLRESTSTAMANYLRGARPASAMDE